MRRVPQILLLLSGISGGYGAATAQLRLDLAAGPPGWRRATPPPSIQAATMAGPPPSLTDGYTLGGRATIWAPAGAVGLEVDVALPNDGHVELRATGSGRGAALFVNAEGAGTVMVIAPGGASAPGGGGGRASLQCDGVIRAPALAGEGISRVRAKLSTSPGGVLAQVDDQSVRCTTDVEDAAWSVRAGQRSVAISRLRPVDAAPVEAPGRSLFPRLGSAAAGLAAAALLIPLGRRFPAARTAAACTWPLLLAAPLAHADLAAFFTRARLSVPHPAQWAILGPLLLTAALLLWVGLGRWMRGGVGLAAGRGVGSVGVAAVAAGCTAAALGPRDPLASAFAAGIGGVLALVPWANVRRVRGVNLLSLGGVALSLLLAEHALSRTQWGASVLGISSRSPEQGGSPPVGTIFDTFDALETTRKFSSYPDRDYPVRPPARTAATRVVALGSSSTAGAYQNDDLEQFWPAELERMLGPAVQVVNQGVGGWTSLHVRRYVETQVDLVDPDVVVVYLGHNDILTPSSRTYADLLEAWRRGDDPSLAASSRLGTIRVYQALRFGIQALVAPPSGVAVPVDDARDNYEAMARVLRDRGGRMLLVREAVSPDPSPLLAYGEMMASLADDAAVAYLDAAPVLVNPEVHDAFLDPCHLTPHGHALLARAVEGALRAEGWLP